MINSATGAAGALGGTITGVYGEVTKGGADVIAVKGWSTGAQNIGVAGRAAGVDGRGVFGVSKSGSKGIGVHGESHDGGRGVYGLSTTSTDGMGVMGESSAGGKGIAGKSEGGTAAVAIYGQSKEGFAGFFKGKVTVQGKMLVDELFAKSGLVAGVGKMFKIDHPLEPATKYLVHASIESSERKNMYDGIVALDRAGAAWITLPSWFESLNTDFRYQLTCIGGYAPVYVASEIRNNRFQIAGGKPGMKVSWQITGVRHDALANANPLIVEPEKTVSERGRYLNPVELGFPSSLAIDSTASSVAGMSHGPRALPARTPVSRNAARSPGPARR